MKKFVLAIARLGVVFSAIIITPAMAADLTPVKTPRSAAPVASWTGFYVGINGGGGMANSEFLDPDCFTCADTKFQTAFGTFGGQIGYNWQWRAMVVGLEGDLNWVSADQSKAFALDDGSSAGTVNFKFDAFTSVRARLGLAYDNALLYVTAGPAWGHFKSSTVLGDRSNTGFVRDIATDDAWHVGLAVGAGAEYMLTNNWSLRGEYLYLAFKDVESTLVSTTGGNTCSFGQDCRMNNTYSAHVARLGLNYKFGN